MANVSGFHLAERARKCAILLDSVVISGPSWIEQLASQITLLEDTLQQVQKSPKKALSLPSDEKVVSSSTGENGRIRPLPLPVGQVAEIPQTSPFHYAVPRLLMPLHAKTSGVEKETSPPQPNSSVTKKEEVPSHLTKIVPPAMVTTAKSNDPETQKTTRPPAAAADVNKIGVKNGLGLPPTQTPLNVGDPKSRQHQLVQTCLKGNACTSDSCLRIHGEFEPVQNKRFLDHPEEIKWGNVVCLHEIRKGQCPLGPKCTFRHFVRGTLRKLSSAQTDRIHTWPTKSKRLSTSG